MWLMLQTVGVSAFIYIFGTEAAIGLRAPGVRLRQGTGEAVPSA